MPNIAGIVDLFPSFQPGERLIDGGQLKAMADLLLSSKTGIVAAAGGTQAAATPLLAYLNEVDTCATNSDSVQLPQAIPGRSVIIYNATGQTLAVFGIPNNPVTGAGDTIAAYNSTTQQATATGVTQATTLAAAYSCFTAGQWKQMLFN